jgi:hypothetical protein
MAYGKFSIPSKHDNSLNKASSLAPKMERRLNNPAKPHRRSLWAQLVLFRT